MSDIKNTNITYVKQKNFKNLFSFLQQIREKHPLVQCITNFVTVNDCANILLAAGASPTMAEDIREAAEAVTAANALVCNMGAINMTDSMILAGKQANELHIPVVLDPVAAGGTSLRRELSGKLIREIHFTAIRGNASEIQWLACNNAGEMQYSSYGNTSEVSWSASDNTSEILQPARDNTSKIPWTAHGINSGRGVDVSALDVITKDNLPQSIEMIRKLASETGSVIAISGAIDLVSDGTQTAVLYNGCPTMARITGSGCMLTTLIGAFCAANPDNPFEATCAAMAVMGICGELAEERRLQNGTGNATFRNDLIDAVFNLEEAIFNQKIQCEILEGELIL